MAAKEYCMQCWLDPTYRQVREAVGVDEDGDPACGRHRVQSELPREQQAEVPASPPVEAKDRGGAAPPAEEKSQPEPTGTVFAEKRKALMKQRTCAVDGCDVVLKANNKSGRCTKHFYVPKGTKGGRKAKPRAKPDAIVSVEAIQLGDVRGLAKQIVGPAVTPDLGGFDIIALRDRLRGDLAAVERVIALGLRG